MFILIFCFQCPESETQIPDLELSSFLIQGFNTIIFPPSPALSASTSFDALGFHSILVFFFSLGSSSMIHVHCLMFKCLQICFSLISCFIPLWSGNILCMFSILFSLLKFVLWSRVWLLLVNIKRIVGCCVECSININHSPLMCLLISFPFLMILYLVIPSNIYGRMLKSPTVITDLPVCLSVLPIFASLLFCAYTLRIAMSS